MAAKRRKAGEWKVIAAARAKVDREMFKGRGVTNIPNFQESGSAAYRRMRK